MKVLQRFIQIEMKEHGCYLANGAWLKGRDNQNQQHGIGFFREVHPPYLNFVEKIKFGWMQLNVHDKWLDIPYVVILHSFCFKPRMVSDKNTRRNIFTIIFLFSFHKGITAKGESSCCLLKVVVLGQKLILGKPSNCVSSG